jgi:hypothetical protein
MARAIIEQRAAEASANAGVSREFFLTQMNYQSLIPYVCAMMSPEGLCRCGGKVLGEPDIHIVHILPPRSDNDWERLHARNLYVCCGSCARRRGSKPYDQWLDEEEALRITSWQ